MWRVYACRPMWQQLWLTLLVLTLFVILSSSLCFRWLQCLPLFSFRLAVVTVRRRSRNSMVNLSTSTRSVSTSCSNCPDSAVPLPSQRFGLVLLIQSMCDWIELKRTHFIHWYILSHTWLGLSDENIVNRGASSTRSVKWSKMRACGVMSVNNNNCM